VSAELAEHASCERTAHAGMDLSTAHFTALVEDLVKATFAVRLSRPLRIR
jgi:hypothetical protein